MRGDVAALIRWVGSHSVCEILIWTKKVFLEVEEKKESSRLSQTFQMHHFN